METGLVRHFRPDWPALIKLRAKLQKDDRLKKAIEKAIERAHGSNVSVGVLPDAGNYPSVGSGPAPTVAQVALWNEYGTINMPARPFFRPAFTNNKGAIDETCAQCLKLMIFEGWSVERALSKLGMTVQLFIQNEIKNNPGPELSGTWDGGPDNKGTGYLGQKRRLGQGQARLIATGLLLRSVQFQVNLSDSEKEQATEALSSGGKSSPSMTHAQARATAHVEKAANNARRAAHAEEFKAFKAARRVKIAAGEKRLPNPIRNKDNSRTGRTKTRFDE